MYNNPALFTVPSQFLRFLTVAYPLCSGKKKSVYSFSVSFNNYIFSIILFSDSDCCLMKKKRTKPSFRKFVLWYPFLEHILTFWFNCLISNISEKWRTALQIQFFPCHSLLKRTNILREVWVPGLSWIWHLYPASSIHQKLQEFNVCR